MTIGGHFSALIDEYDFPAPGNHGYESARSCLYALVKAIQPRRVHIPRYICDAVPNALEAAQCPILYYSIDPDFCVSGDIEYRDGDLIVLVNYYGLCERSLKIQLERFPADAIVVDNSQAYFQPPLPCLANIYSARKFLPVPDGGFIETRVPLSSEPPDEEASLHRFHYLLKRVGRKPEFSRPDYLAAEESLETPTLRQMSTLTHELARTANHHLIVERRRRNFLGLKELSRINMLNFEVGDQVPLTYPLMVDSDKNIRNILSGMNIFTPKYWQSVIPDNKFEENLIRSTIFIPIDHRYGKDDMEYICNLIHNIL